jgi:hypothetical protein
MLIFKKKIEGKYWILKNILFVEMKIPNLINYFKNMCQRCKGNTIIPT